MKSLDHHVILYDNECPMCNIYTSAFIKARMLPANGRLPYQEMPAEICSMVDPQRAVNEIALVDRKTGETTYGIFSLFKIIGARLPVFNPLFHFKPFIWLMVHVYAFISYNRKVIVPAVAPPGSLQPAFNRNYRIAYLCLTWLAASFILSHYMPLLAGLIAEGAWYREYLICGVQVLLQASFIIFYQREKAWAYLGNLLTVFFAWALLLVPVIILSRFNAMGTPFYATYIILTAGWMFLTFLRRCKTLQVNRIFSTSLILFSVFIVSLLVCR